MKKGDKQPILFDNDGAVAPSAHLENTFHTLGVLSEASAVEYLSEVQGRCGVGQAEPPVEKDEDGGEGEEGVEQDPCRAVHPDAELRVPRESNFEDLSHRVSGRKYTHAPTRVS